MKIQLFDKINDIPDLISFKDKLPIFATQEYANYLKNAKNYSTFWFHGIVEPNDQFIIPFAIRKKNIFKNGMFLTAAVYLNDKIDAEIERELLNSVISLIRQKKLCDWIAQPPNWAIFNSYPGSAIFAPFGTYKIELQSKTIDELFNSIYTKDRSDIRKALNDGVEIRSGFEQLDDAMNILANTAKKAFINVPSISELHSLKENIRILTSYYQGVPQSSAVFFVCKYAWYNMYAGTNDKPSRGSNSLLYWSAIKLAKEEGVLFFDFVGARIDPEPGSKQERIQLFKRHFGGDLFQGFLWKMPISKFKYFIYNYLIKIMFIIKRKKFKGDIIDQERNRKSFSESEQIKNTI